MVAIGHQDTNMHITPRVRCSSVLISCPLKESKSEPPGDRLLHQQSYPKHRPWSAHVADCTW